MPSERTNGRAVDIRGLAAPASRLADEIEYCAVFPARPGSVRDRRLHAAVLCPVVTGGSPDSPYISPCRRSTFVQKPDGVGHRWRSVSAPFAGRSFGSPLASNLRAPGRGESAPFPIGASAKVVPCFDQLQCARGRGLHWARGPQSKHAVGCHGIVTLHRPWRERVCRTRPVDSLRSRAPRSRTTRSPWPPLLTQNLIDLGFALRWVAPPAIFAVVRYFLPAPPRRAPQRARGIRARS